MATAEDFYFMAEALRLAEHGLRSATPNPRVGCVLVRGGQIVGSGWHERAGEAHAEVHALRTAGAAARGATAYVTLEPCSHHGRTPPCADALIGAGVSRVVAAMADPNPLVSHQGLERLAAAGIATESGVLAEAALELNRGFVSRMTRQRPWVRVKLAASLDGRTALANGQSQWITGPEARADVQRWRARSCAILTGSGTVLADNPRLTVRDFRVTRQPLRVVVDSQLCTPSDAAIIQGGLVLLAHTQSDPERGKALAAQGAQLWQAEERGSVPLAGLLQELARRGINEVLVEAGPGLCGALLAAGLVDELLLYQAPMVLGSEGRGLFDGLALNQLADASRWQRREVCAVGSDTRFIFRKAE